jgi:hypothetical protein
MKVARYARLVPALLPIVAAGCLERRLSITSEPPGATVIVNDVELGRTPLEAGFTHCGLYDVRVEKDGYDPLRTAARAPAPFHEYPPFDLAATALPVTISTVVPWNFTLTPAADADAGLLDRARALRGRVP